MHLGNAKVLNDFGIDWPWSSVSFIISNLFFLYQTSCLFFVCVILYIFVRPSPVSVPHPTGLRTYADFFIYLGETIGVQPASTQRLALDFTSSYLFSPCYKQFTCQNFICQHSAIAETTLKQGPLTFILFDFQHWDSPDSFASTLFLAR